VTLISSSSGAFDLLFFHLAPRNRPKRVGLIRTAACFVRKRRARFPLFLFFFSFLLYLFSSIILFSSKQFLQSNSLASLFIVAIFRGNPYVGVIVRAQLPYSRSSIDLFRDPRLLVEIDSDISALEALLKLHTFPFLR